MKDSKNEKPASGEDDQEPPPGGSTADQPTLIAIYEIVAMLLRLIEKQELAGEKTKKEWQVIRQFLLGLLKGRDGDGNPRDLFKTIRKFDAGSRKCKREGPLKFAPKLSSPLDSFNVEADGTVFVNNQSLLSFAQEAVLCEFLTVISEPKPAAEIEMRTRLIRSQTLAEIRGKMNQLRSTRSEGPIPEARFRKLASTWIWRIRVAFKENNLNPRYLHRVRNRIRIIVKCPTDLTDGLAGL